MEALLTSIFLVAVAEIGDKTQLLLFMLAARLRKPWPIVGGILLVTLANHALAGWLGILLAGWMPQTTLAWIVGLSFVAFGLWTLHPDSLDDSPRLHKYGVFMTSFVAFFLADGRQDPIRHHRACCALRCASNDGRGTTLGMTLANVPPVWMGEKSAARIPLKAVRLLAASLFVVVGMITLWGAFGTAR